MESRLRCGADRLWRSSPWVSATSCASSSATLASEPRNMIGRASPVLWSELQGRMQRAPAPFPRSLNSLTSFAGSATSSKRYGVTTTFTPHGEGVKRLRHPVLGPIELEYSAFAVDGRPDLSMVVYNPVTSSVADRIRSLVASRPTFQGDQTT